MSVPKDFVAWKTGDHWTDKCHLRRPQSLSRTRCGRVIPADPQFLTVVFTPTVDEICRPCLLQFVEAEP